MRSGGEKFVVMGRAGKKVPSPLPHRGRRARARPRDDLTAELRHRICEPVGLLLVIADSPGREGGTVAAPESRRAALAACVAGSGGRVVAVRSAELSPRPLPAIPGIERWIEV